MAVVGIVANVFQICSFAGDVIDRLNYCLGRMEDAPRLWKEINTTLPALTLTVQKARDNAKANEKMLDQNRALELLTQGCISELKGLKDIVDNVIPKEDDTKMNKTRKALRSMIKDSKMERIKSRLDYYVTTMDHYQTTTILAVAIDNAKHLAEEQKRSEEILAGINKLQSHTSSVPAQLDQALIFLAELTKQNEERQKIPVPQDMVDEFNNIPATRKVSEFIQRPKISTRIKEQLALPENTKQTAVLQGMGGIGKPTSLSFRSRC